MIDITLTCTVSHPFQRLRYNTSMWQPHIFLSAQRIQVQHPSSSERVPADIVPTDIVPADIVPANIHS